MRLLRPSPPIPFTDVSDHVVLSKHLDPTLVVPLSAVGHLSQLAHPENESDFVVVVGLLRVPFRSFRTTFCCVLRVLTTSCRNTHWKLVNEGQPVCISARNLQPTDIPVFFLLLLRAAVQDILFPTPHSNRRRFHQGPSITNGLECQPFPAPINHFPNLRRVVRLTLPAQDSTRSLDRQLADQAQ